MSEHPYKVVSPTSGHSGIQQSIFPAWHDRRHSNTTDTILGGRRKSGGFEALQDLVNEKRRQEDTANRHSNSIIPEETIEPNIKTAMNKHDSQATPITLTEDSVHQEEKDNKLTKKRNRSVRFAKQD